MGCTYVADPWKILVKRGTYVFLSAIPDTKVNGKTTSLLTFPALSTMEILTAIWVPSTEAAPALTVRLHGLKSL